MSALQNTAPDTAAAVRLEPFTTGDIDRLISWIGDRESLLQWAGPSFTFPLSRDQLVAHLDKASRPEADRLVFKVVSSGDGTTVGHIELSAINRDHRNARLSRVLIGPDSRRGQGLAAQALNQILKIAFDDYDLNRVELYVYDFNADAIHCYERAGFRPEGLLREVVRHGDDFWNVQVMGLLARDWRRKAGL
ncbi:MAG: GNAT family protein [Pseudomonadota bacterium]